MKTMQNTDLSRSACRFLFLVDKLLMSPPSSQSPLVELRTSNVCVITKDPQWEYNDLLKRHRIRFVSRDQSHRGGETQRQIQGNCCSRKTRFSWTNEWYLSSRVEAEKVFLHCLSDFESDPVIQPIPMCLMHRDIEGELERAI